MEASEAISIVNIVSSGKINAELDLATVAKGMRNFDFVEEIEHSRRKGNRLLIEFADNEPLVILAPSGVYVVTGADTYEETDAGREYLFAALSEMGYLSSPAPDFEEIVDEYESKNIVFTADVGREVNLSALAISLGLGNTEYEPEQFPGLVFRPSSGSCTILVFATGKIVITGVTNRTTAEDEYENLVEQMDDLLDLD